MGIYSCVLRGLESMQDSSISPPSPESIWSAALLGLSFMLVLSSAANALGAFFHAKDIDLLLKTPISKYQLFIGKFYEICFSSCWMLLVFGVPMLAAFMSFYQPSAGIALLAFAHLIPFLVIYCALGTLVAILFASLVPAHRTRELLMLVAFILIIIIGIKGDSLFQLMFSKTTGTEQIERVLNFIRSTTRVWLPSYWTAVGIGALFKSGINWHALSLLLFTAGASLTATFLFFYCLLERGLNLSIGGKRKLLSSTLRFDPFFQFLPLTHVTRAIIQKDLVSFLRDLTQALQMLLLVGLSLMYLINFRALGAVELLSSDAREWWQGVLTISNLGIGAFLVSAISTRFVFPSVSLEGQSFWLLQSAPCDIDELLRAKFYLWFIPVSIFAVIILTFGSYAIGAGISTLVITALATLIICYGIVSVAIGMGAYFARFDWDHPSELAASFGSLVYILFSIALIGANLLPTALLLLGKAAQSAVGTGPFGLGWFYVAAFGAVVLAMLNIWVSRIAFRVGSNALKKMGD